MDFKPLPPVELLRKLLEYDPAAGTLKYQVRTDGSFMPDGTGRHSRENKLARWNGRFAGKVACSRSGGGNGYLVTKLFCEQYKAHRLVWLMHYGEEPDGQIDHINGDRTDNRINNLRVVGYDENSHNRALPRNNISGAHGVRMEGQKWAAVIRRNGRIVRLGTFATRGEAIKARRAAERELGYHPNHGRRRTG